jgi:hypothetical protein
MCQLARKDLLNKRYPGQFLALSFFFTLPVLSGFLFSMERPVLATIEYTTWRGCTKTSLTNRRFRNKLASLSVHVPDQHTDLQDFPMLSKMLREYLLLKMVK